MKPAEEIRGQVQARHPGAIVVERRRKSIRHSWQRGRRNGGGLVASIGPIHYGDRADQEIDTTFLPDVAPWAWQMNKADYNIKAGPVLNAGMVVRYIDRVTGEYVEFQPHNLQYSNDDNQIGFISGALGIVTQAIVDRLFWPGAYGAGIDLHWRAEPGRMAKKLEIASGALPAVPAYVLAGANPVLELNLNFKLSSNVEFWVNGVPWNANSQVDTATIIEARHKTSGAVLWGFLPPLSWDSGGGQNQLSSFRLKKQGGKLYLSHRIPLSWIQDAARVWPIYIDATIDEQVNDILDDSFQTDDGDGGEPLSFDKIYHGLPTGGGVRKYVAARWEGITIDVGATPTASWVDWYHEWDGPSNLDEIDTLIDFEDNQNPAAFGIGVNDISGRARTTASVAYQDNAIPTPWPGQFNPTPSLNTIMTELFGKYTYANDEMVCIMTAQLPEWTLANLNGFLEAAAEAAKLHIEWEVGGDGGGVPGPGPGPGPGDGSPGGIGLATDSGQVITPPQVLL